MDGQQFFTEAMKPGFANEMNLQLTTSNPDPESTFSHEAVEKIMDQVHDFVMARLKGVWDETGQAPKSLFANLKLTIGEKPLDEDMLEMTGKPWTTWKDDPVATGLSAIDGSLRRQQ